MVPALGPMCLVSCALSRGPKIDQDRTQRRRRARPLQEEPRGFLADVQGLPPPGSQARGTRGQLWPQGGLALCFCSATGYRGFGESHRRPLSLMFLCSSVRRALRFALLLRALICRPSHSHSPADVTYSLPSTQITRNTVTCKFTLCSEACDLRLPKAAVLRRILKVPSRRMSGRADSARSSWWGSRSDLFDLQLGGPGRAFIGWEAGHGLYQSQTAYPCCA